MAYLIGPAHALRVAHTPEEIREILREMGATAIDSARAAGIMAQKKNFMAALRCAKVFSAPEKISVTTFLHAEKAFLEVRKGF